MVHLSSKFGLLTALTAMASLTASARYLRDYATPCDGAVGKHGPVNQCCDSGTYCCLPLGRGQRDVHVIGHIKCPPVRSGCPQGYHGLNTNRCTDFQEQNGNDEGENWGGFAAPSHGAAGAAAGGEGSSGSGANGPSGR